MDIELSLSRLQVLRDPGVPFTDGVMSRVGDVPVAEPREGVAQIAEARARRRSRRILIATVVTVAAAAAIPTLMLKDWSAPPAVQDAAAQIAVAQPSANPEPVLPLQVEPEQSGERADPLDCLDPDVIHGLLLQGLSNPTFSTASTLPPEMAAFKAPRQFTLIGSTERAPAGSPGISSVSVAYRSKLAPAAARAEGLQALAASGWIQNADSDPPFVNVFRSASTPVTGETWCREGQPVAISASAIDGVTYVILSASRNSNGAGFRNACDQPPRPLRAASILDQYMPALEMPRDPATGRQVSSLGGGGSSGDVKRNANSSFTIRDSIGNVAQHFARQMAEQGWMSEATWMGSDTAGSTWTRAMDSDTTLRAMLMVSAFDNDRYTTVFNVVQTK